MIVAFIIRGLKEFGEPTRKALIMDLAPEDKKAGIFGMYYLVRDVIVSFAAFGRASLCGKVTQTISWLPRRSEPPGRSILRCSATICHR